MRPARRARGYLLGQLLVGAGTAVAVAHLPLPGGADRWARINHRGRAVSLTSGPALALASVVSSGLPLPAAALAGLGSAGMGAYDDVVGARPVQSAAKGFRGHLAALRQGTPTAGALKVVGIGAAGIVATGLLPARDAPLDLLLGGGVVALSANLLNLLDLRPGRALKAGVAAGALLALPGPVAAAAALLPGDLGERTMLGDAGANALGAVLGLAVVGRGSRRGLVAVAAGLGVLTAASEVVSYSRVIDAVGPLRWLDRLGRRA